MQPFINKIINGKVIGLTNTKTMNKCYKCGQTKEGTYQQIGTDLEKDRRYEEFFCYNCGPQEQIDKITANYKKQKKKYEERKNT